MSQAEATDLVVKTFAAITFILFIIFLISGNFKKRS